jgi:hypothetical protein
VPNPLADYLFLAALFVPAAGILGGVIYLIVPSRSRAGSRTESVQGKAHG